jgi:tetratricopeptide (TPR) repeat protein
VSPSAEPARDAIEPPVSGTDAPSCRELLGKSLANRNDPKRAGFQTVLANRELVRGNVDQAHAAYCLALAWDRANVERHLNLARLYLVRRDFSKAAENARGALALDPESRGALGVAGDAWAGLHETERARTALLQAERKPNPSAADVRLIVRRNLALARRVERLRDFSLAERLYRRVLLLEPAHAGAMTGLAGCLLRLGDRAAAEAWTRKASELKKTSTMSRPRSG